MADRFKTYKNDLLLRALRGESTPRTPIWLMRQAGRTDPQYNKLKADCGLPLHDMFRSPDIKNAGIFLDVPKGLVIKEVREPPQSAGIRPGD